MSETSYQDSHHQWSAGKTEFYRSRHTRECNGKAAAKDTQENTYEQCDNVRFVKALQWITQYTRYSFYSIFGAYHHDTVTYLKYQIRVGKKIDTRTVHTRDVDIVHAAEVQHTKFLSINFRFGYQNTTWYHRHILLFPVYLHFTSDKGYNSIWVFFWTDHK